jgi:hypothetical protein
MSEAPAFDRNPLAPLGFLAKTGLCQAIAAGAAVVLWGLLSSVWATILAASACAVLAAAFLRLSTPWIAVNAILPFGAASALAVQIPHEIFLMLLVALACTYLPAFWTRVPYYPTQRAAYSTILAQLPADRSFSFVDIGCGFGDLLALLGDKRPNGTFILFCKGADTVIYDRLAATSGDTCVLFYYFIAYCAPLCVQNCDRLVLQV